MDVLKSSILSLQEFFLLLQEHSEGELGVILAYMSVSLLVSLITAVFNLSKCYNSWYHHSSLLLILHHSYTIYSHLGQISITEMYTSFTQTISLSPINRVSLSLYFQLYTQQVSRFARTEQTKGLYSIQNYSLKQLYTFYVQMTMHFYAALLGNPYFSLG